MPFSRKRSIRRLIRAVSTGFNGANEDDLDPVDVGPSLVLATLRTNSSMMTRCIKSANEMRQDDIIILLMGPLGSGKTTFIETVGGVRELGLKNKISAFRICVPKFPDSSIVLVYAPAFGDRDESDVVILSNLSNWLNATYRKGIQLSGLIYFHQYSDTKMEGTALRNWRAFEKICGEGFNKVVLTTTVWNDVDDEVGDGNAQELEDLWRTRAVCGWSMKNFTRDRPSAANVLSPILEDVTKGALRMQREVIDFNMSLKQTTAARILYLELQDLQRQCKRNLIMIRDGLKNPSLSKQELNNLEAEYKKTSFLLVRVTSGLADLESTPSERLQRLKLMTKFIMMTRFPSALGHLGSTMLSWRKSPYQMDARGDGEISGTLRSRRPPRSDVIIEEDGIPWEDSAGGGEMAQIRQHRRFGHVELDSSEFGGESGSSRISFI